MIRSVPVLSMAHRNYAFVTAQGMRKTMNERCSVAISIDVDFLFRIYFVFNLMDVELHRLDELNVILYAIASMTYFAENLFKTVT